MASIEYPVGGDHGITTMWHPLLKRRVYKRSVISALARATFDGKVSTDRVVRYTSPASGVPRSSNSHRNLGRDSSIFDDVAVTFEIDGVGGAAPVMEATFGRVFRIHRQTTTGWIEYERAVDLSPTSLQRPRNLFVTLHYYTKVNGSDPPRFVYGLADYTPIQLEAIICPVDMVLQDDGTFGLDPVHAAVVSECMEGASVLYY
jgi:hypothetical protein